MSQIQIVLVDPCVCTMLELLWRERELYRYATITHGMQHVIIAGIVPMLMWLVDN